MNSRKITYKQLKLAGACKDKLAEFKKLHGESCMVTIRRAVAEAQLWDWGWLADSLLSCPAQEAYNKAIAPAQEAYRKAVAPAQEAYNKAIAPAWEAYNKAVAPAWEAYNKAVAPAQEAYNKAVASAWAEQYIKEGEHGTEKS